MSKLKLGHVRCWEFLVDFVNCILVFDSVATSANETFLKNLHDKKLIN
jgi:hypothetical protein